MTRIDEKPAVNDDTTKPIWQRCLPDYVREGVWSVLWQFAGQLDTSNEAELAGDARDLSTGWGGLLPRGRIEALRYLATRLSESRTLAPTLKHQGLGVVLALAAQENDPRAADCLIGCILHDPTDSNQDIALGTEWLVHLNSVIRSNQPKNPVEAARAWLESKSNPPAAIAAARAVHHFLESEDGVKLAVDHEVSAQPRFQGNETRTKAAPRKARPEPRVEQSLIVAPRLQLDSLSQDQPSSDDPLVRYRALGKPLPLKGDFEVTPRGQFRLIQSLMTEFPWMSDFISRIDDRMRLQATMGQASLKLPPFLLVGPPSTGKTRFAQRLAALSGCGHSVINAGGSTDNRLLTGTAKGWSSATPCMPALVIAQSRCANPVIVVDEIDKVSKDVRNGNLEKSLLTLLEPGSAKAWHDECLVMPLNLSRVNWILTANDTSALSAPFLSRVDVVRIDQPLPQHFEAVMQGIQQDVADSFGRNVARLPQLSASSVSGLKAEFALHRSPRLLYRAFETALAAAVKVPAGPLN
jgi:ATPase family associated with various cellular activities (AAA)